MAAARMVRLAIAAVLLWSSPAPAADAAKQWVYVGTYTTVKDGGKGIYRYDFDPATGQLTSAGLVAEAVNPSFLAIHPNGKYLFAVGEFADDRLEAIEDRIEARPQPTDREVAAEHRSIGAEALDAMQEDFAQAFGRRARVVGGQRRNLDVDVGRRAEQLEALLPSLHAVAVTIDRAAAVVDDEGLVGKVPRQSRDLLRLIRIEHQLEEKAVASE